MIIGKAISPFALRKKINGVVPTDPDAQLFITATGITGTNATATNKLVIDLKSANIWTKMKAVYPMVGGTATTCKFNLKNPVDSNAAYRLVFSGGGTFSANGYQPGGVNGYANTNLIPSSAGLNQNSTHISYYSRTNNDVGIDMGATSVAGDPAQLYIYIKNGGFTYNRTNAIGSFTVGPNTDGRGMYLATRITSDSSNFFKNTTKTILNVVSTGVPFRLINIGALNDNNTLYYGSKECAFSSIGDGLTDAESLALYNAVQTFNTTLGRQV